jgi:hypothetical protein
MHGRLNTAAALGLLSVVLLSAVPAAGTVLEHTVTFSQQDLTFSRVDGYDVITLQDCDILREVGRPQLPVKPLTLSLPGDVRILAVRVVHTESSELLQSFLPAPAQPPRILPVPGVQLPLKPPVPRDRAIYDRSEPYPAVVVEHASTGHLVGNTMVGLAIHPVQFVPDRGKLRFFRSITVSVEYEILRPIPSGTAREASASVALALVDNPNDLAPAARQPLDRDTFLDPNDIEYVIITSTVFEPAFAPLAEWKTRKGIPAAIITTDWINTIYPGSDEPERIRAFIADAHDTWGAIWFLLGGDTSTVPARTAFAMDCEADYQPDENDIPCDLYYADLDGSWNADGDGIFGEIEDGVDLYADVFVGRASVGSQTDAEAFVVKLLAYEHTPGTGYQLDMLMAGEILWSDPYTDSGIGLDMIDHDSVPPRYDPIIKLYQSLGNETRQSVINALNGGVCHFLHCGHAWYTVIGCGEGYLDSADASALTNGIELPVVYSIGCWPAAFDKDCIAEHFIENPGGGAVAFIGNSRYGWGSPGNPGYGYSDLYMAGFYGMLFQEELQSAGEVLAAAKATFVPFSMAENVYRWHQYQINLLGDPEMPIWTDTPTQMTVAHADTVVVGSSTFDVVVWTQQGTLDGALVCISNGSDVYERSRTASDGVASFALDTAQPDDIMLTVTAPNYLPYEALIPVRLAGAYLRPIALEIDDSAGGNGDGLAGPNETVFVNITVRNYGTTEAGSVTATISTDDPWVTVVDGQAAYGDIPGGAEADATPAYSLSIADGCPNGHVALLDVVIQATGYREIWLGVVPLTVGAPVLRVASYSADDALGGDGDGLPEPDETVVLMVEVVNDGLAEAPSPDLHLWTFDPDITVTEATAYPGTMPPSASAQAVFEIELSPDCPVPCFPELYVEMTSAGVTHLDTLIIAVGITGFSHDFEDGESGWTHGGAVDLWHLGSHRARSGVASWYCGQEGLWSYSNNMECRLDSPEFILGMSTELTFWCWYDVTIYGADGLYVVLMSNGEPSDTLDFIGSGGALETLGSIGNDWLQYTYPLIGTPGDTCSIRFVFDSDYSDVAEGFFVDDVSVSTTISSTGTGLPNDDEPPVTAIRLNQNCPNPFSPSTTIRFSMGTPGHTTLAIYGIQGRLIRVLSDEYRDLGDHAVVWDGKDEFGEEVAAGVYLYRLSLGEFEETRKMILIR